MIATALFLIAAPADLTGTWEIQSLGSDRVVQVEHNDTQLLVHRVLYPEFEGEKYRLDHLFRGTIDGTSISGTLLVKEPELPDFEVLRPFTGSLEDDTLTIDGLPLKRVELSGEALAMLPVLPKRQPKATKKRRKRRRTRGVQRGKTEKKVRVAPTVVAESDEDKSEDSGADLYESILGGGSSPMVQVSREIEVPNEAEEALARGIAEMKISNYAAAFRELSEARDGGAPATVHRWLGLAAEKIGRRDVARTELKRALRLDPTDLDARAAYNRVK